MVSLDYLKRLFGEKILVLDGALGTLLRERAGRNGILERVGGNLDMLNILAPEIVESAHAEYIEAGTDIIETNTFNSNSISQQRYQWSERYSSIEEYVRELNIAGAKCARRAVDSSSEKSGRKVLVAGSVGPTGKMLSLGLDASKPYLRDISFDELSDAYRCQIDALVEGSVDIILIETIFDPINAKCALYAVKQVEASRNITIPVMVSATVNDKAGRLLAGQSLEALFVAILNHRNVVSFGINCSFGIEAMEGVVRKMVSGGLNGSGIPMAVSIYPNAGIPDQMGIYNETPEHMAARMEAMASDGVVNIIGGCCGTTPAHIKEMSSRVSRLQPRAIDWNTASDDMWLSGLEPLLVNRNRNNFINVGERTNVSGSSKFAGLIKERNFEAAAAIARKQIEDGATIIDINVDDPMSDTVQTMGDFVRYMTCDPEIARVPFMFDSSHWEVLVEGLKNCVGRCVVNSISLKEGERVFIEKAREVFNLGAAVIVMAFDEQGQAVTFQRKIDICRRAYDILTKVVGFKPCDIIFDVNILTIGTGMEEHANYAVDFIKAVEWIKKNLPGCKTSGGVSNLSFAFRGNNTIRGAMHCAFLYHAIEAGLDMAIVNPSMLQIYDNIEPKLLKLIEDLIFNRTPEATNALIEHAQKVKAAEIAAKGGGAPLAGSSAGNEAAVPAGVGEANLSLEERIAVALVAGKADAMPSLVQEALKSYPSAIEIIQGPLMSGMERVGDLFNKGRMFLPQVVKSAKVMRDAVSLLEPYMSSEKESNSGRGKVLLATVKGDVHDIGKNIVAIVMACNALDVTDLGVMVEPETILERAIEKRVDVIGLSGLITPSLEQMESVVRMLQENRNRIIEECGHLIPVIVGGATASALHTALKLDTLYEGGVFYNSDASSAAAMSKRIVLDRSYISELREKQQVIRDTYNLKHSVDISVPHDSKNIGGTSANSDDALFNRSFQELVSASETNGNMTDEFNSFYNRKVSIKDLREFIDWGEFLHFWGFKGRYPQMLEEEDNRSVQMRTLIESAARVLDSVEKDGSLEVGALLEFRSGKQIDDILEGCTTCSCHTHSSRLLPNVPANKVVGFLVTTSYDKVEHSDKKSYDALLRQSLCARLAQAAAQYVTDNIGEGRWLRVAIGYPMLPDHKMKRDVFKLVSAEEKLPVSLTSTAAITPDTSVCAVLIKVKN